MGGKDGAPATANFLSGLMKSIPPMNELYRMAGLELPDYLGKEIKKQDEAKGAPEEEIKEPAATEA
ncbi:MAG TPA: flotillin family protein, partial [Thermoclostridium caenicola]|nr:flotillin family protein [Thermoclostridium caenicola]